MVDNARASLLVGPWSRLGITVGVATMLVDQAHKIWMISIYDIAARQPVDVTPFMTLVYTLNKGISYSLLSLEGFWGQLLLASVAVAAVFGLCVWLARGVDTRLLAVSVGLIIGGALGNAIDRLRLGGVADFISLHAFGFYWYVFNIADVAIVAGVVGMLYDSLVVSRKPAKKAT
jgi:signal peptidase II